MEREVTRWRVSVTQQSVGVASLVPLFLKSQVRGSHGQILSSAIVASSILHFLVIVSDILIAIGGNINGAGYNQPEGIGEV